MLKTWAMYTSVIIVSSSLSRIQIALSKNKTWERIQLASVFFYAFCFYPWQYIQHESLLRHTFIRPNSLIILSFEQHTFTFIFMALMILVYFFHTNIIKMISSFDRLLNISSSLRNLGEYNKAKYVLA